MKTQSKVIRCPNCGSVETNAKRISSKNLLTKFIICLLPESLMWGGPKIEMFCQKCKYSFFHR